MIYQKIWASVQFGKLSNNAKLLYLGLITLADDEGRLNGNPAYLRGQVFPYEESLSVQKVKDFIDEIVEQKLIVLYEVEGTEYIKHPNWTRYQKLRKDRFATSELPNDNQTATKRQPNDNHKTTKDSIVKHSLGKDSISIPPTPQGGDEHFASFWKEYPKKVSKVVAQRAFIRLNPSKLLLDKILEDVRQRKESEEWQKQNGEFILNPATYLNQRRWEDETKLAPRKKKPFYRGDPMDWNEKKKKWFVIRGGEWLEYADKESEIEWR